MKTLKSTALVLGLFSLLAGTTTLVRAQDYQNDYQNDGYSTGNISLQTFYDELSPYGTWIQDPQYGYVWRPNVDQSEFRPYYSNGRWAMTEYGNTWVSNYDWGWAPFHYGRWVINSYRQWIWLPDTNWGPAWVDWRSGDGYYGWAPMAPSISINLSFGRRYVVPEFCWNFIPQRNIYINTFPRYDYGRNNVYIRNTTIINNTYVYNRRTYYGGPRVEDIRRATNRDVTVYRYAESSRPGASRIGGREVAIYRPRPERNAAIDNRNAAPRRFEQGNAGISRGGRNEGYTNRDQRGNTPGNNDNRLGSRDNRSVGRDNNQPNNRGEVYNRDANGRISRGATNGIDNGNRQDNANRGQDQQRLDQIRQQRNQDRMGVDQQRNQRDMQPQRGQDDQQRAAQMEQQRAQRNEQFQQQRTQRDAQMQQQRNEQMQQQRAQQAQQQQQERAQRDAQVQQQRNEQMQQQRAQQAQQQQQERAQRDAQVQQQRNEQMQQQRAQQAQQQQQERAQRDAQAQQQRAQQQQQRQEQRREAPPQQQRGGGEGGRPSRGGRG